ncbi:2-oxoglutarate and iron-dependent oxygenase domain-containing protein [uncultured Pigmentiphaga sp.]|uniref:isopenicillin N synthase family dioxygenase n=1 Tax=uncultured Pigmentiphaga sp. TaxID=340361 RepID=UPI00262CDF9D|nr:2-oxoglutarate and iron-dependent oxygenase domain-containing protein [uncultured Pigmentiphaga sp.]
MALPLSKQVAAEEVPVIDLTLIHGGSERDKAKLTDQIVQVCQDIGFFYVVNHGLSPADMNAPFEAARTFFALPSERKQAIAMAKTRHYRGYLPMKTLGDDPSLKGNIHEAFHFYLEREPNHPSVVSGKPLHGPNQWPEDLPGFRETLLRYYAQVDALAYRMLELFEMGLGLPVGRLRRYFNDPMSMMRLLHYPPQEPNEPGDHIGVRPHTDNGVFTILSQDETGGLEILGKSGEWIAVPPIPGSFVINVGEMMKLWSDGIFLSTPHRVVNRSGRERYSVPYFLMPDYDVLIEPLVKNTGEVNEPILHNTTLRGERLSCGEILSRVWTRIWPSLDLQRID